MTLAEFRASRMQGINPVLRPVDPAEYPATEEYSYEMGGSIWPIRCEAGRYVYLWVHPAPLSAGTLAEAEELLFAYAWRMG